MGNNNVNKTNDILVKVDQNNLIYIDPNSVLDNGVAQSRGVEPENLVMYVNLEADLIPRTTLVAAGDQSSLSSIAGGTLNFLKNQDGRDYDTKWTDAYTNIPEGTYNFENTGVFNAPNQNNPGSNGQNDNTAQSFGIDSISISVAGANFIPSVMIKFIDVRGKTLFESPENSPYAAFFHLPWPIFYLTVKGFFGKAIKYRLHLVKFNTRFNPSNGNMEVDTTFVGSTYAYMADISLESILNAPYFYASEAATSSRTNEKTGETEIVVSKSTKGYQVLRSVYQEYVNKGLLPSDFPVKTLRELIIMASTINRTLENEIFESVVDPKILSGVKDFENLMSTFEGGVLAWKSKRLSPEYFVNGTKRSGTDEEIRWFKLSEDRTSLKYVVGPTTEGTLEYLIQNSIKQLENNSTFGKERNEKLIKNDNLTITPISFTMLKNIKDYYVQEATVGVDIDGILDAVYAVLRNFIEQRNKLESDIETHMNEIVKQKDLGIGFEPTIRNIIGVLLANADTYIRLMKSVHNQAFENADTRKKILSSVLTDSDQKNNCIYPWPEIKVQSAGGRELVLMYPGSREMIGKLQSNDSILWPEVEFVENFYEISTKKTDPLTGKEGEDSAIEYVFDTQGGTDKTDLSVLTNVTNIIPYADKSFSSVLYEIYERAKYTTSFSPFSNQVMIELANAEFENLKAQLIEDVDIVDMLKQNITTPEALLSFMQAMSTYNRFPYYLDQLPTIWYIQEGITQDYTVTKYIKTTENTASKDNIYKQLSNFLLNYKAEDYRTDIYPFNSSTYSVYIGHQLNKQDLKVNGLLTLNTPNDFIISPVDTSMWVKDGFTDNLFEHTVDLDTVDLAGTEKQMLNTPYFHKQLFDEFNTTPSREKYVGSAYLLLNSLPFKDLDDTIVYTDEDGTVYPPTLMSTLFREIGASHYIPYHMMLKWGSIYHRYKKHIESNYTEDILDLTDLKYERINGPLFFDGGTGNEYHGLTDQEIGFHPYYESIFYQIANGYTYFNPLSGDTYDGSITSGITYLYSGLTDGYNIYSSFVDNTKFGYSGYTLLPTNGSNVTYGETDFDGSIQENFRIIWGIGTSDTDIINYSGYTFPGYTGYTKDVASGDYSLSGNYRKVIDLIATFKPDILDVFEQAFLDFSSEKLNEEVTYSPYNMTYSKFQDLLQKICSVTKESSDSTKSRSELMKAIKDRQSDQLQYLSNQLLSTENVVKVVLSNPREVDNYVLGGFTGVNVQNFSTDPYFTQEPEIIELYLGEDIDGYYNDFFQMMDIEENETNVKQFRQLVYMYAGLRVKGQNPVKSEFVEYLKNTLISPNYGATVTSDPITNVSGQDKRLDLYLSQLVTRIQSKDFEPTSVVERASKQRGYNDDPIKLELYNYFKSFNDKWTAGNSIGQRTLMEEVLFLDKANKDIGNSVYIDMQKLTRLKEDGNRKINLFSAISLLVQDTGFDIRALPAYVNFYGNNFTNSLKTMPSKNIAQSMFGAFLDVDTQDSSPKIILQYTGPTSKHLELADIDKKQKYKNDGFDIGNVNNNPIIVAPDVFTKTDFSKSNKVVAFEVSFGDQNQSIFKGVELDQATLRNTSESFQVLERLGRNETGSSTSQIDIGLFNIYRSSSYQCKVTAMGNMMIQPTMYFYVKNIPLFRGSYLITDVEHHIRTTGIETIFTGTRIPAESLPDPSDSFLASYRPLFDRLVNKARAIVDEENRSQLAGTAVTLVDGQGGIYTTDPGYIKFNDEKILKSAGITDYGIPYNGAYTISMKGNYVGSYIQMINYKNSPPSEFVDNNNEWLRAVAIMMGGTNYQIDDGTVMNIVSNLTYGDEGDIPGVPSLVRKITWGDIKNLNYDFYSSNFTMNGSPPMKYVTADNIIHGFNRTEFLNPRLQSIQQYAGKITVIENEMDFDNNIYKGPINVGPNKEGFGIGLSPHLMQRLSLIDGQVVYFRMS